MSRLGTLLLLLFLIASAPPAARTATQSDQDFWSRPTVDDSELEPVTAEPCGSETRLRSINSDTRAFLRFKNMTSRDVKIYWIDFEGERDSQWTLKPGQSESLRTYLTHPFVVVDEKGACVEVYTARRRPGIVVLSDPGR